MDLVLVGLNEHPVSMSYVRPCCAGSASFIYIGHMNNCNNAVIRMFYFCEPA